MYKTPLSIPSIQVLDVFRKEREVFAENAQREKEDEVVVGYRPHILSLAYLYR